MLSFLLSVASAINDYEVPAALCPPCHPEDEPETVFGVIKSLLTSVVSMLVIVFPLYKTFKAWESNRLRACRTMLAYWSAMTLLNALKDVTDEIVGKHINVTIHHLLVAALKLAPLVLGPDAIYDMTVRSFFEHHEAEMDAVVLKTTEMSNELKVKMEPTLDKVKEQVAKVEAKMEPTLEQIRESLRESFDTVKSTMGMETEPAAAADTTTTITTTSTALPHELSAEEALRKDEELTMDEDSSSKTGLRQRSARADASSNLPAGVTADAESEIERAKAAKVLVEKIVWGHGLSAKNDEYQRQMKAKEVVEDDVVAGVHTVANQFNTVPAQAPTDNETYNRTAAVNTTTTTTANNTVNSTANTTSIAPPLPPRPEERTGAITITNSTTTQPMSTTGSSIPAYNPTTYSLSSSTSPNVTAQPSTSTATATSTVASTTATTGKTVIDSRSAGASGSKKILLDTRSIPNVVETYAADYQKEQ